MPHQNVSQLCSIYERIDLHAFFFRAGLAGVSGLFWRAWVGSAAVVGAEEEEEEEEEENICG